MSNRILPFFSAGALALLLFVAAGAVTAATTDELLAQADAAWAAGDLEKAEQHFKEAALSAETGEAELRLGGFYISQTKLDGAVDAFQAALTKGLPTPVLQSRAFVGMGIAYLHSGRSSLARAAFDEAVAIDPAREQEIKLLLEEMDKREDSKPMAH